MSTENTPSATVSFRGGSWQWDDGTATCHGYASAAEAAAGWQAGTGQAEREMAAGERDMRECDAALAASYARDAACRSDFRAAVAASCGRDPWL